MSLVTVSLWMQFISRVVSFCAKGAWPFRIALRTPGVCGVVGDGKAFGRLAVDAV
jgi:hypothetical protein